MSRLEVRNVWQSFADHVVLERLSLSIASGSFVTIVGASGCGKTTLLEMVLGQTQPTRGQILLDGVPLPAEPSPERGVVFQRYSVFPHLTALENVLLSSELRRSPLLGRLFGAARREARALAWQWLEAVGLGAHGNHYPERLSGGQQQRLAIAQALVNAPQVLLLDEPFGALDPGIRRDMHGLIRQVWRQTGVTVLMITHDLSEAFSLGTRVLVFDKPRIDPQAPHRYGATITYDIAVPARGRPLPPAAPAHAAAPPITPPSEKERTHA